MTFIVIHQPYANFHEVSTCVYHKQFATLLGELELLKIFRNDWAFENI